MTSSRIEAAAKEMCYAMGWTLNGHDHQLAESILAAADAHDLARGVHRIVLDEATVERAAEGSWDVLAEREGGRRWDKIGALNQARWAGNVSAVLAAAVQEER